MQFGDVHVQFHVVGPEATRIGNLGLAARRIIVFNIGPETVWLTTSDEADPREHGFPLAGSRSARAGLVSAAGGVYASGAPADGGCSGRVPARLFARAKSQGALLVIEVWGPSDSSER